MPPLAAPIDDLVVHRARLHGGAGRRRELEAGLAAVRVGEVVPSNEILFVPQLRLADPLLPQMPPSHLAARLTDRLRRAANDALVDPLSVAEGNRPLRFRSFSAYASWLLAIWLTAPAPVSAPILRAALRGQSVEQWQRRVLLPDGRLLVQVIRSLAAQRLANIWVGRLAGPDLQLALRAIAITYAMPQLSEFGQIAATVGTDIMKTPPEGDPNPRHREVEPLLRQLRAQIETEIPQFGSMPPAARLVLVAAIGAARKPGAMRSLTAGGWRLAISEILPQLPREEEEGWHPRRPDDPSPSGIRPRRSPGRSERTTKAGRSLPDSAEAEIQGLEAESEARPALALPATHRAVQAEASEYVAVLPAAPELPSSGEAEMQIQPSGASSFFTGFGGLFFLLNVFIWMRLYPDFTRPLDKGLAASPFWLLAKLGRRLFGKPFARDPLYRWLIENGTGARLPRTWRPDPEWLAGIEKHVPHSPRSGSWLAQFAAFVKFRLAHAAHGSALAQLRLAADVLVEDDMLTLRFRLADLPLSLRIAGLDRDPGWLHAEGRSVAFEFV